MSGIRILNPKAKNTPYEDIFPNIDLISYVRCPTVIIHGTADSAVECIHG